MNMTVFLSIYLMNVYYLNRKSINLNFYQIINWSLKIYLNTFNKWSFFYWFIVKFRSRQFNKCVSSCIASTKCYDSFTSTSRCINWCRRSYFMCKYKEFIAPTSYFGLALKKPLASDWDNQITTHLRLH